MTAASSRTQGRRFRPDFCHGLNGGQDEAQALGEELGGRRRRRRKQAEAANYIGGVARRLLTVLDALERGDEQAAEEAFNRALAPW